ncbi:hypothetical protein D0Z08_04845 [Nocardioides immobilis]|uniref:Uncharacterized protein n=1 Tax=Nocardioides immobilis TaxID=2049295 RepID=A0A417Y740_9ACTN|nr:hypothetical protein D0Z08_04845 [Nocardioides immobilis]
MLTKTLPFGFELLREAFVLTRTLGSKVLRRSCQLISVVLATSHQLHERNDKARQQTNPRRHQIADGIGIHGGSVRRT